MNFNIVKGDIIYLEDCIEALMNSKLGAQYFSEKEKAKRLYDKMGYIEVGRIPDLYKKGVAEIIMMKILKSS